MDSIDSEGIWVREKGGMVTHEKNKHRPISRLAAVEELAVVPPAFISADIRDILDHLAVLELD
jgi:hypothetical protein